MSDVLKNLDDEIGGLPVRRGPGPAKINYSHDAMIDLIIQNPGISQGEIALSFGYTAGWVSQIIASDAFQSRLAARKDELVDPTIRATIEDRFKALVIRSLEILQEKLDKPAHQVADNLVIRGVELGSKALGYGARETATTQTHNPDHLNQLAERLVFLQGRVRERNAINVEAEDVTPKSQSNGQGEGTKPSGG